MSDDQTLPPRQPNTPRTWLRRAWEWAKANRDYSIPLACLVIGAVIGKLL